VSDPTDPPQGIAQRRNCHAFRVFTADRCVTPDAFLSTGGALMFRVVALAVIFAAAAGLGYGIGFFEGTDRAKRRALGALGAMAIQRGLMWIHVAEEIAGVDPFSLIDRDDGTQELGYFDQGTGQPRLTSYVGPPMNSPYGGWS
jgi:hypothetical protein